MTWWSLLGSDGWQKVARTSIRECPPSAASGQVQHVRAKFLPEAFCDADSAQGIQTLIPQEMAPEHENAPILERILTAVLAGRVLDYAVSRIALDRSASSQPPGPIAQPELVQAYFISVDGVLRIWTLHRSHGNRGRCQKQPHCTRSHIV